jgi:hypothetical protein
MPYSDSVRESVLKAPKTLGNQLGRYAIHFDLPVTFIAQATGATRQTVYNWFNGGEVLLPYRSAVTTVLKIMQVSPNVEEARRKICAAFNLPA